MTTSTLTLASFLLARIDEDEAAVTTVPEWHCTDSARGEGWGSRGECPICGHYMFDGSESVTGEAFREHYEQYHNPARVLAECAAKRKRVELFAKWDALCPPDDWPEGEMHGAALADAGRHLLRVEAQPYADHPDFREEWRNG